jgi:nicotinate-nucleotide pyrophosphorylase (carboxylating)
VNLNHYLPQVEETVQNALDEDLKDGDITTGPLVPAHKQGTARFLAKAEGVLAGIVVMPIVFQKVDPFLKFNALVNDGSRIKPGMVLGTVEGNVSSILKAERTALNLLQHMSGIATLAAIYVDAVRGLPVKILDTRKTAPCLRVLEKYSVTMGGGTNHRFNLGDMVLIKDNHIAISRQDGLNIIDIVRLARSKSPKNMRIEIETTTPEEALVAAEAGADIVMLDNMGLDDMRKAVQLIDHRAIVEASGGVSLETVRSIAETGVDWISVGAITHSAPALDISLKLQVL